MSQGVSPTICVDFDGVIHGYSKGWRGATVIYDDPVPGARPALAMLREWGIRVVVFSTRAATPEGKAAMLTWLAHHGIAVDGVTHDKPMASLYIDDRALRFDGKWEETLKQVVTYEAAGFKTWQKV